MVAGLRHSGPCIPGCDQLCQEKDGEQEGSSLRGPGERNQDQVCKYRHDDVAQINIIVRRTSGNKRQQIIGNISKNIVGTKGDIAGCNLVKTGHSLSDTVIAHGPDHAEISVFIVPCSIPRIQAEGIRPGDQSYDPPRYDWCQYDQQPQQNAPALFSFILRDDGLSVHIYGSFPSKIAYPVPL